MANIGGFQDLVAWQRGMDVVEAIYAGYTSAEKGMRIELKR